MRVGFILAVATAILISSAPAFARGGIPCYGNHTDGSRPSDAQLAEILRQHRLWIISKKTRGARAELCRADLRGARFFPQYGSPDDRLHVAQTLAEIDLRLASLQGVDFVNADLTSAILLGAKLDDANLRQARLGNAYLAGASLRKAKLAGATLTGGNLSGAHLHEADLSRVNARGAEFDDAEMPKTTLFFTVLADAGLRRVNLREADLRHADLRNAELLTVRLGGSIFEPDPESVREAKWLHSTVDLPELTFRETPTALVVLRDELKKKGLRDQERQVTYALKRSQDRRAWHNGGWGKIESGFSWLAFDLPSSYGLHYGFPLKILGAMIVVFAVVYTWALRPWGQAGIWRVWSPDRIVRAPDDPGPIRLSWNKAAWPGGPRRGMIFLTCQSLALALLFSLVSAFHIGWREFNVGSWISRLQAREYTLRGSGWVRVLSGIQSLLSVYLLALWASTYFGRPFE